MEKIEHMTAIPSPFDIKKDYSKELLPDEIKTEDGKQFVFLRGLERLAKERGIKAAICVRLEPLPRGMYCTYRYEFFDGCIYEGSADATIDNCDGNFKLYTTAMAESRSKARALRTALGISMCSVEEKSDADARILQIEDTAPIEPHQVVLIRNMASKLAIGKTEIISLLDIPRDVARVDDFTRLEGRELMSKMNALLAKKIKAEKSK